MESGNEHNKDSKGAVGQKFGNLYFGRGVPKWVVITSCLVGGAVVPFFAALSPQLSELVKGAIEVSKSKAENERTALGTVLEMVSTNTKQVLILSAALEAEKVEKRNLSQRVSELEKSELLNGKALRDCEERLMTCRH